ncbi:MAG: cyclic nucleotide-binding domain-containing protein [Gemmatimonadota bacterium]
MTADASVGSVDNLPLFRQFQTQKMDKLRMLARRLRFEPGQTIFREGDASSLFYVVVSGHVALELGGAGPALRVQIVGPGDEFGWSALLPGRGKHFQARTMDAVEALAFEGSELLAVCREDPAFGFELMQHLLGLVADRLAATRVQLSDFYSPHAKRAGA